MQLTRTIRRALTGIALAAAATALAASAAYAQQQVEVTAEVDRVELAVGEVLELTVTIIGPLNPQYPSIPKYDGLRPLGPPSRFSETTIRNEMMRSRVSYHYRFVAEKVGNVTIAPISVTVSGQTYRTEPITVAVLRGIGGQTPPAVEERPPSRDGLPSGSPMFVTASIDNDRPYLGQQVTYTFKFYRRSVLTPTFGRFGQPRYEPPDFSGFWNNYETDQTEYAEKIDSNVYRVVELQTVLFPSVVGEIVIEPAVLTVPVDFFEAPNFLESAPVVVEVRPLPPAAPAGFTGAVGRFDVAAAVDTTTGKVNEPVQLTVNVQGEGNIETLPDPAWPEFEDWRVFESTTSTTNRVIDGRLVGSRVYESILVPRKAGALTIPEIRYTYYDPDAEQYAEAATPPMVISIAEGDELSPLPPSSDGGTTVERTGSDVRHIRPAPSSLRRSGRRLTGSVVYWAAWGVPLLALAGAVAWRRRQTAIESDRASACRRNALPDARTALARAGESGNDPRVAAAEIVSSYLAARLGASVDGLTREVLYRRIREAGVPPDLVRRVEDTLAGGEAAKYAPSMDCAVGTSGHLECAARLLTDLEKEMEA